uniref:glucan 1,3-beta-glucosidase n=1 Tax=Moniliophthora roreri TaxID=221103 RepID=A0A0W0EVF7_MONRR
MVLPLPNNGAKAQSWTPALNETFRYGVDRIRGVNFGGWLNIEPFMKNALFEKYADVTTRVVDEWTLQEAMRADTAGGGIALFTPPHDQNLQTEKDFHDIRLPIPYWAIEVRDNEPYGPHVCWNSAEAYRVVREVTGNEDDVWISIHEGSRSCGDWDNFLPNAHWSERTQVPCDSWAQNVKDRLTKFAGEFSNTINECGLYLNGVEEGVRYDGSYVPDKVNHAGSCDRYTDWPNFTDERKEDIKQFAMDVTPLWWGKRPMLLWDLLRPRQTHKHLFGLASVNGCSSTNEI